MPNTKDQVATTIIPNLKKQVNTLPAAGIFHLFVVYIIWSSTYLFIRIAVGEGGFAPFILGASRMIVGGVILIGFAYFRNHKLRPSLQELKAMAISGTLLWVGGNGLVMWAEQHANSGFTALMVASSPIWVALLGSLVSREKPSLTLVISLLLGFIGLGVLMAPSLIQWNYSELFSGFVLVIAAISLACGSFFQTRNPVSVSAPVSSGYQHIFASLGFLVLAVLFGESWSTPTFNAWLSWGYLVLFGSVFAFTSFIYTLRMLPLNIAMTYAYVNPVLALFLGWWLLDETITIWTLSGAAMVILGVIGVFKARKC